ncbi:unnamed protein product [Rhizoctonia solani]|uniref:Peptidase S8/S53 domain-containing protein n=1 Tax=Rhizoctonia solani TaxID=456999 RepID=A0A8H3DM42_9AGAM|nr:unnamed protein product [Rhizoctonia solani]
MRSSFIFALLTSSVCVLAGPVSERVPITKRAGPVNPNSYIIKLKDGVSKSSHLASLLSGTKVAYTYDRAFQGYSAHLEGKTLEYVRQSKDVEYIVQDEKVKLQDVYVFVPEYPLYRTDPFSQVPRQAPKFPLASIQSCPRGPTERASTCIKLIRAYTLPTTNSVDAPNGELHLVDTPTLTETDTAQLHVRSSPGESDRRLHFGTREPIQHHGHQMQVDHIHHGPSTTHMIPPPSLPIGFGDDGSANLSDIIQGINWVITTAPPTGRPSIISITVTISGYQPFDTAVTNAINAGIHVVVAAGDQNVDASTISPARVAAAVTVGAVATNGSKLSTSNFGSVVDVWGPGKNVPVAWISSPSAAVTLVGTTASAASNVAGILAVAIDNHGNKSPAALQADLKSNAQTVNGLLIPKVW